MWPLGLLAGLLAVSGCGRPKGPARGPPGAFPVLSVVAPVLAEDMADTVDLVGELRARESVELISEVDARLVEIGFQEGEEVEEGKLLFRFDAARLEAHLARAEAEFRLAEADRKRSEDLLAKATISQQEFDQADAAFASAVAQLAVAKEEFTDARVVAPLAGVVGRRDVSIGQFVRRGERLTSLVQADPLQLVFHVPERHVARLQTGLAAEFWATGRADPVEAEVVYLASELDPRTRTLEVKASLPNPGQRLRPGMFGRVRLALEEPREGATIPVSAIMMSAQGASVVVRDAKGIAEFRPVVPGRRMDGRIEIVEGLAAGEVVVVEGHQKIAPGAVVIISPKSKVYGIEPPPPAEPEAGPAAGGP